MSTEHDRRHPFQTLPGERRRNRTFDLIRLVLAYAVVLTHSFALTGHIDSEPFHVITRQWESFGTIAVFGFFVLSGYLLAASWTRDPSLGHYLVKRALRILPGFLVAVFFSVAVAGIVAPGVPHFFGQLLHGAQRHAFLASLVMMGSPDVPPAYPGMASQAVNGSLWTLHYESRAYLLIALLGAAGVFRKRERWLAATVAVALWDQFAHRTRIGDLLWRYCILETTLAPRMFFFFFMGGCLYLYRDRLRFHPAFDVAAAALCVDAFLPGPVRFKTLALGLAYLVLRIGSMRLPRTVANWYDRVPDISYGVYIFSYPIQQLLAWYLHPSTFVLLCLSLPLCTLAGLASWYIVEQPMLALKPQRSLAPQPRPQPALTTT